MSKWEDPLDTAQMEMEKRETKGRGMKGQNLVVTSVSDRLVAMVALHTLDRLLGAHLSGKDDAFEDRFQEAKALVLSERAQSLLRDFKELGIK